MDGDDIATVRTAKGGVMEQQNDRQTFLHDWAVAVTARQDNGYSGR